MSAGQRFVPGRPLVVLAGWLGSQPRALRRYEALYHKLGFQVLTQIPSPWMVALSTRREMIDVMPPDQWPRNKRLRPDDMQSLAWEVLRVVHLSQCSLYLFHGFSNGGGFLWEQLRRILQANDNTNTTAFDPDARRVLKDLKQKLKGIVFDSSPCYYHPGDVYKALSHCSWQERVEVYMRLFAEKATKNQHVQLAIETKRAEEYFESMKHDSWNLPQLYLCSRTDSLTPIGPLRELIRHRKAHLGRTLIFTREWEVSPHCCHLLTHPREYETAVESFVEYCLTDRSYHLSRL